jgi:DNA-binding transcriptional LysR family regulator
MRWLAPRLPGLTGLHPELIVNFAARSIPFDFAEEAFDAAIHFGSADWPDAEHDLLFREEVMPVCSPGWLADHPVASPSDMLDWPLLLQASRRDAWTRWFAAAGADADRPHDGPVYEQFLMMAHAAAAGVGAALIPSFLIAPELAAGTLVSPLDIRLRSDEAYYLVRPAWRPMSTTLRDFRAWLLAEARRQAG